MIEDFKILINKGIHEKNVRAFSEGIPFLVEKYRVSEKTLYNRFKSVFKESPREVIEKEIYPTKQYLDEVILSCNSSKEVREVLNLSSRLFVGLYDSYYGVSTFKKARLKILNTKKILVVPQREDNRAIIYSQILGDGYYDVKRHALRIVHGEKQAGYLKWKVSLLNSAYPKTSTVIKQREHAQGHVYFDYYTNLGNVDIPKEEDCVSLLTNLGWLLWYFDDGSYNQNISIACKRSEKIRFEAINELKSYGINARQDSDNIIMCGQENDLLFYQNFIEPFINDIPLCMKYKVEDIVEKVVI